MNNKKASAPIAEQILEEATAWFIDCNEGELDVSARERFNQWLRRSPEHVRAYLEIAAAWQDSSRLHHQQPADRAALLTAALAESNVVSLDSRGLHSNSVGSKASERRPPRNPKFRRSLSGVAAAVLLSAIAGSAYLLYQGSGKTYTTDIGEQRSVLLADGSTVELNARSRLCVHFSQEKRMVELLDGQALFRVKQEAARPFVVTSNGTQVRVIGTQFDVNRKSGGTVVTVLEGRVAVTPPRVDAQRVAPSGGVESDNSAPLAERPSARAPILLRAGEQLTVSPRVIVLPTPANIDAAIAWTQRKLVFNETPLQDAINEFNRYNSKQIIIDDPEFAAYHIRGSFESDDPSRLIQFLQERFGADVTDSGAEVRISRNKKIQPR